MGYVVEARHVALDERVALKFLLPEYAKHPEASARFLREARAAVKIKSEHVARVSDHGTLESGAPYMVMEFLDGSDLAKQLQERGPLAMEDGIDYVLQASEAIAEAHSYGIVHRDLKPANLFLASRRDGSPLVKVLDFGISKMSGAADHALTKTATAMGSALYMSPEQMQETRGVDHRTDIYSLGITLFELLAGTQPFHAETLPQLCAEVLTGTPRPLREFRPDLSEDLAQRLARAYERDKNIRYQSIAEFAVALAPYAPQRSQSTVERIARMGGLPPPKVGEGVGAANFAPQPPAGFGAVAQAGITHGPTTARLGDEPTVDAGRGSAPNIVPGPSPVVSTLVSANPAIGLSAQTGHKTMPLPAQGVAPELPSPVTNAQTAAPEAPTFVRLEPDTARIEAERYSGPMSSHAAAAFASAAKANPSSGGRSFLFVALGIGALIGIGGGVLVFALGARTDPAPPVATAAPPESAPIASPEFSPSPNPSTATPLENTTAGASSAPEVEATATPPTATSATSATTPSAPKTTIKPTTTPTGTSTTKRNANSAFQHR